MRMTELVKSSEAAPALIIDDNYLNLVALGQLLNHFGVKAETCMSGDEALAKIKERHAARIEPFKFLLADYNLLEGNTNCGALKIRNLFDLLY